MGVKGPSTTLFSAIFNFISGRMVSRSGEQLQLIDKFEDDKPMLEVLSNPGRFEKCLSKTSSSYCFFYPCIDQIYFKTLAKFKVRRAYANVANDRTVAYWTASMEIMDYFYESKGKLDM